MKKLSINQAWENVFDKMPEIDEEINKYGYFDIDSRILNEYKEARNMCYHDNLKKIPEFLQAKELSVLAIRNGRYRLAHTRPFVKLPTLYNTNHGKKEMFELPNYLLTMSSKNIKNESRALEAALLSGMLDYVFSDDGVRLVSRGRERCEAFDFTLPDIRHRTRKQGYQVEGVQIEVDGGYEGKYGIHLVEAKMYRLEGLSLRQTMYPHIHYQKLFGCKKPISSYFLFFDRSSLTYHFHQLNFDKFELNERIYDDLPVIPSKYIQCGLAKSGELQSDFIERLNGVPVNNDITDECRPFPQANDFSKVLALFEKVHRKNVIHWNNLFIDFTVDPRQFRYYSDALRWLRLVEFDSKSREFSITERGRQIGSFDANKQIFEIAKSALSNDLFNQVYNGRCITDVIRSRNRLTNGRLPKPLFLTRS